MSHGGPEIKRLEQEIAHLREMLVAAATTFRNIRESQFDQDGLRLACTYAANLIDHDLYEAMTPTPPSGRDGQATP